MKFPGKNTPRLKIEKFLERKIKTSESASASVWGDSRSVRFYMHVAVVRLLLRWYKINGSAVSRATFIQRREIFSSEDDQSASVVNDIRPRFERCDTFECAMRGKVGKIVIDTSFVTHCTCSALARYFSEVKVFFSYF